MEMSADSIAVAAGVVPLALALGLVVLAVRSQPQVDVEASDGVLYVRFGALDRILTLRREVRVPVTDVRGVTVARLADVPREGLRLPGTEVPGLVRAGSYGTGATRDLWDVRTAERVLWIELDPAAGYRRVILQVSDPHTLALRLRPVCGTFMPS